MKKINTEEIRDFYEKMDNVWPVDDHWHLYSRLKIEEFVKRQHYFSTILNVGSGGSNYGLVNDLHHVDIVKNKIDKFETYTVASAEFLPFDSESFHHILCVGSVINYCDAHSVISELSRVSKPGASLALEFESSWGYEHLGTKAYKKDAEMASLSYNNENHNQWLYSSSYISSILKSFSLEIVEYDYFHYLSGLHYNKYKDENSAAKFTKYDWLCRRIPIVKYHSNNIIYKCVKK